MNLVDLGVIGVLLVSALIAFYRGFVREVLTVAAWVGAVLAAIYLYPSAVPHVRPLFPEYQILADVITVIAIFIVVLVLASIVSHLLTRNIRESAFGPVDRSLGLVFGVARGALLLCLAYLALAWLIPPQERPEWIAEARSLPLLESGAIYLKSLVPPAALDQGSRAASAARSQVEQVIDVQTGQPVDEGEPGGEPGEAGRPGYDEEERSDLDRLIQGTQ